MEKGERGEGEGGRRKPHVLAFPFPFQGHINPLLQFSKRLVSKGLQVTFVIPFTDSNLDLDIDQAQRRLPPTLRVHTITINPDDELKSADDFFNHFEKVVSLKLKEFIHAQEALGNPVSCVVYDSIMPWALEVARDQGVVAASFFTQSNAVNAIYYRVHEGLLRVPVKQEELAVLGLRLGLPPLEISDLPSLVYDFHSYPSSLRHVISRFSNFKKADWVFDNTFDTLEEQVVSRMASQWPIKNIGPTIPSTYLDNNILKADQDYGLSLLKPQADTCSKWLDSKETGSVVYVSFGSLATMKEDQMEDLAWGITMSNNHFLWVVRQEELNKLPINFIQDTADKGLVVTWCPQLQVLAHRAVGCFVTHCGWNSTLEALSLGVPMVAVPQWTDQTTNAKFVMDVWEVGIRVKVDTKGFFTRQEIDECIREVMDGERGLGIKKNSAKWKKLAMQAVDEGGSSDNNIQQFVEQLVLRH
ncbi:hypothetical protein FEM48_Zijuj01G0329800 [Ziziphus jujuba var. spinosa]|uniref:Glycosyltransferase n=1 Tax=Ziziphus jujuba var. spinosa TaxID=714518 RepID=A0A978W6P2_ZIZJJ|nr:UDP-glycosyltransferase 74E2-like [Ziziphus jujuba var. spinosa]KAH7547626.1 hypothetical protein FEM48_Zijuj01G0329800 [Ziziphus jujuba var. spinosa]